MAKKTKKYPPSRIRYMKKNPYITLNVPAELKNKFEVICKEKGLTKSQYVRQFVLDSTAAFDNLIKAHAAEIEKMRNDTYQIAYQKGATEKENALKEKYNKEIDEMVKDRLAHEKDRILDETYSEGYNDASSEYKIWYYCNVCKKPIPVVPNGESHKAIIQYMKNWGHKTCQDKTYN